MDYTLKIWRQDGPTDAGRFDTYQAKNIDADCSFLEMLDIVVNEVEASGKEPFAFDSDCREGICGTCGLVINGRPHGPGSGVATCQLYMREFADGATLVIEPWRATAFPVMKDLIVDRASFDRIITAGGYISANTGAPPDGNAIPIPKENAELAMDAASCIGCGACVAACKNASAMLFVAAKVSHLALLPQGQPERNSRVSRMVAQMDEEGFGGCTNESECEAACPKEISIDNIARLNLDYWKAKLLG